MFMALCNFFPELWLSPHGPLEAFDIFQQTGFSKTPKGPLFTISKTLHFLRIRNSADFRRSRLLSFVSSANKVKLITSKTVHGKVTNEYEKKT